MNSSSLAVCVGWSVTETRMLTHYRSTGSAGATVIGTQGPSGSFNTAHLVLKFNKGQSQCHISEITESHYTLETKVHDRGCRWSWNGSGKCGRRDQSGGLVASMKTAAISCCCNSVRFLSPRLPEPDANKFQAVTEIGEFAIS